ncbi:MAG TPA: PAS domain S-box protein [Aestuariivirga sp.]
MGQTDVKVANSSDLAMRREAELAALFRLTDRLYRAREASDIYDASLAAITSTMNCMRGSILLFDASGVMKFVAQKGLSANYVAGVEGHTPWRPGQTQPDPIFIENIDDTNESKHIKQIIKKENICGLAFLPLVSQGVVIGKFMTYYEQPHKFTPAEVELAVTIARQLGFAIERFRAEVAAKKVAEELRESEERFRLMSENAPVMIWMSDAKGGCLHLNRMQREFWDVEEDALADFDWRTSMHPEDMPEIVKRISAALLNKTSVSVEGRYRNAQGTYRILHTDARPRVSPDGELLGMIGVNVDITEQKEAEQLRREMNDADRYRMLVEGITDYAVYLLDVHGNVASWNAGAQRFKGYTASEIIGQNFSTFYTPEDQATNLPKRALAIAAKEGKFETEGWRVRKDGSRFWTHVVIDPIRNSSGNLLGFAKITRDLTERKHAEDEKKKADEALQETRDALFHSQKREAIGQLTGGIAHDFNNLLMVIQSSMELLRKRLPEDERLTSLVDNATEGVKRGVSLTQRMLSFARRQDLDQKSINLHELVFEMTDLLQRSLGPSIMIQSQFPLGLSLVRADTNQLESALLNLAVNARDAMPNGGPLTISAHEENIPMGNSLRLLPGKYVCLSIEDKGEGMSEDTITRATEPFFTTKGVGKGTGLGLSMVHGFAEQSGGRLRLKSVVGVGTTAELWLPTTDAVDKHESAEVPSPPRDSGTQKLAVLAVDDDILVRMGTTAMLEDLGHKVTEANSGEEALKFLAQGLKIDLVVTDQAMPRMTGVELAEAILAGQPKMPIVLATGYSELPAGIGLKLPRLSKPFSQKQLDVAMKEALRMSINA